ncbi:metal ABC transporter permease [Roseivirga pacifica]|uniref:metal ABC transporter permease n=1 Tax=Roseivirga pacifica TaxID=1267423 RepID=UPI0020959CEB|nr:iron chelate uptake ABC transporter family permease subunit [Roseivirga pacifica]MCO6360826.1 iron chelate uptake ABC transporter family permease subunit [Roseivirga pacifica]MCO6368715.1 iron chelate uptake ABC transporter family permease subunit [Roseivirga pacifica]MCO6372858.1 iron chelate uptake ABC transporter family permease subunit [Roseivirga pacifica]MCO6376917.1 iron chelate uptake ABC transporter family permease subunit [Roseivirga pacifica]MCO6377805.1 iron chelate uptake ABC t
METLKEFFSFQDPSIIAVTVGAILLSSSSAVVGTFTFLKKKALVGDAVAHSVLPGICLAFILSGTKNPIYLIIGAFVTGWLSLVIIDHISKKSKLKEDTAIALILSVFFGIGILMLTNIQHSGNAAQTGLDSFLFGKAAALVGNDLIVFGIVAVVLIATVILFFKELKLMAFDQDYAEAIGLPVKGLELLLTSLTVLAVVTGIQAVGVVLMAAMLITPAAAARFWTNDTRVMTLLAAILGGFSGLSGAFVSYAAPAMPTGPWIVMIISAIALISFFAAPKRGIISRGMEQRKLQRMIMDENLLKELFHLGEKDHDLYKGRSIEEIIEERYFPEKTLRKSLNRLRRQGFLTKTNGDWRYTEAGKMKGQRVVKLHRLWELYLSEKMKIAPDHVHEDAETIEHIITPELEERLEKMFGRRATDPHDEQIPY